MSEWRLSPQPSSAFLSSFDPKKIAIHADDAFAEIAVGRHEFQISFPTDGQNIMPKLVATAKEVLAQITELDAIAMRDVDGTQDDGDLFAVEVLSETEVDLHYSAVSWNSSWREMFRRQADGRWVHHGIRKHA
ncbi:MAG TPA: hypothetical protein PLE81_09445 [Brevundimonas sp.]|uniref:hypothetical protein n=1 Tax=Brevundimonas sp. TaxID=1871086 RepID=UPI002BBC3650|nr:hypothetical protein [Brevundimonas sp.]HRH20845.1 hypothetical protein [Brevundimonas sp.]